MQAILLLADSAQVDQVGKVHALGLGWAVTVTPTPPGSLVVIFQIPWTATNVRHKLRIELLSEDGDPVANPAEPDKPFVIEGEFEAGRPAGLPAGMSLNQPLAVNLPVGLPLAVAKSYEWRLSIDGHHEENWSARFFVGGVQPGIPRA